MRDIKFSILISSFDEADGLRRTLDSIFLHAPREPIEAVVVDDASRDGSADFLSGPEYSGLPIRLLRNDRRRGLIFSRARAAEEAAGEYLCVLDAHSCVPPAWLEKLEAHLREVGGRGLVVPTLCDLERETWTIVEKSGLGSACTIINPFLDFAWSEPREVDGFRSTATIAGGAWMCSRKWYRHIGGLDSGMILWGGENIDIALRTWVMGGWCLVADDVRVGHLYKAPGSPGKGSVPPREAPRAELPRPEAPRLEGPAPVSGLPDTTVALAYNKIRAAHNAFEKETLRKVILNLRFLPGFASALAFVKANAEGIVRMKEHVEPRRERPDRWLIETFELPVLEPAFFHHPRFERKDSGWRRRPRIALVVSASGSGEDLRGLIDSVREKMGYGRLEVNVVSRDGATGRGGLPEEASSGAGRLRFTWMPGGPGGGLAEGSAALQSEVDYLVFLSDRARVVDPHWLEKLILLFERRPRMFMVSPRIREVRGGDGAEPPGRDRFDVLWDWDSPEFSRQRMGLPLAAYPYQALSCPAECFMVHRERFLELGGFDRTVRQGPPPVLDLAVHGWLAGYEVFCHPGVSVGLRVDRAASDPPPCGEVNASWRDYARALPALKYFTTPGRIERARAASPAAAVLREKFAGYLDRRRREFLGYARFDDDWLFYKFGIEEGLRQ